MYDWDDYKLGLSLHRRGTIRAAAESLGITHATVSRRLAALEKRIGATLFERIDGEYRPTRIGIPFLEAAQAMETAAVRADRLMAGLDESMSGPLTISMPDAFAQFVLMDELIEFQRIHPDIELSLHTSMDFADLDYREADLVLRVSREVPEHLVGRRLYPYGRTYYASRSVAEDLKKGIEKKWIGWPGDEDSPDWVRASPYPEATIGMRVSDQIDRHKAACHGAGMVLEACCIGDSDERLVRLTDEDPELDRMIWVLTHPDLRAVPKILALMRWVSDALMAKRDLIQGKAS